MLLIRYIHNYAYRRNVHNSSYLEIIQGIQCIYGKIGKVHNKTLIMDNRDNYLLCGGIDGP